MSRLPPPRPKRIHLAVRPDWCRSLAEVGHNVSAWLAPSPPPLRLWRVGLVVAHCKADLSWLLHAVQAAANGSARTSVDVYSSCGIDPDPKVAAALSRVSAVAYAAHRRPNVGRNDGTFLQHIVSSYDDLPHHVFFLKDSSNGQHSAFDKYSRSVGQMADQLRRGGGFDCGRAPQTQEVNKLLWRGIALPPKARPTPTSWAVRSVLMGFRIEEYRPNHTQFVGDARAQPFSLPNMTLGKWVAAALGPNSSARLAAHLLWPVCFGGTFAASRDRIRQLPLADWRALSTSLARGDNIEEGHYMERLWAAALGRLLPAALERELLCQAAGDVAGRSFVARAKAYTGVIFDLRTRPCLTVPKLLRARCWHGADDFLTLPRTT